MQLHWRGRDSANLNFLSHQYSRALLSSTFDMSKPSSLPSLSSLLQFPYSSIYPVLGDRDFSPPGQAQPEVMINDRDDHHRKPCEIITTKQNRRNLKKNELKNINHYNYHQDLHRHPPDHWNNNDYHPAPTSQGEPMYEEAAKLWNTWLPPKVSLKLSRWYFKWTTGWGISCGSNANPCQLHL